MNEYRPARFEILPPVVKNLIIINCLVFLAQLALSKTAPEVQHMFALNQWRGGDFKVYQYLTSMFMHSTIGPGHIFMNMFALWMFGSEMERIWGPKRFLTFYLLCGIGAGLLNNTVHWIEFDRILRNVGATAATVNYAQLDEATFYSLRKALSLSVGASGAIFGILAAFCYLFPNRYIYLYFFVPMKTKWFMLMYVGLELGLAFLKIAGDNVDHWGHLGGALTGFLLVYFNNRLNRKSFY
jgi:membrane associated rhomboid family serine protease